MKKNILLRILNAALLLVSHIPAQSASTPIDNGYTGNYTYAYGSTDTTPETKLISQEIIDKIREIVEKV